MLKKILLLTLIFSSIASLCFAATPVPISVITTGGGDYTALNTALATEADNIVTSDEIFTFSCSGVDADATLVSTSGWTTDATRFATIKGDNNTGKASTTHYRIVNTAAGGNCLDINDDGDFFVIDQIEITGTGSYTRDGIVLSANAQSVTVKNCIIHDRRIEYGGIIAYYADDAILYNNVIYDITPNDNNRTGAAGIYSVQDAADDTLCYGNTVHGCTIGIRGEGDIVVKNNLVYNNTTDFSGTFDAASDYNFSKDDSAPEAAGNSIWGVTDGKTPDFVSTTGGSEDFHLQSTSDAIDVASDLGSPYDYDIDGDFRDTYTPWDIGADEYVSAAPPAATQPVGYGIIMVFD